MRTPKLPIGVMTTAFACMAVAAPHLYAQTSTGTISGLVTDTSGQVVPGATANAVNVRTGASQMTITTSAGLFYFNNLPVGDYRVEVELTGFKKAEAVGLQLHVNDRVYVPITLELGNVIESVVVTRDADQIQTESTDLSNLIAPSQIATVPLSGRVYSQVLDMVPGISPDSGRLSGGTGLNADTMTSVNGGQSNSNIWLVDGQPNMGLGSNNGNAVTPAVDAVEEFKLLRGNYSAEFGGGTGGVINVVTKGGTQQFHGTASGYFRNEKLNATDFFLNASGQDKSKLRQQDFGFTAGGPAWPSPGSGTLRDFFFFSYEGRRERRGAVKTGTVPTARQANGTLDPLCEVTEGPCTPQPFDAQEMVIGEPNVPLSAIDPNARAILQRYPAPNANFTDLGFNWIDTSDETLDSDQYLARLDHQFGAKTRLMVRYIQENQGSVNYPGWGDDQFPSVNVDLSYKSKALAANVVSVLTPRLVNDFQFGYTSRPFSLLDGVTSDPTLLSRSGFTYTELFPETSGSFPRIRSFDGFDQLRHQANYVNRMEIFQLRDNLSYTVGAHNLKAGFGIEPGRLSEMANGGGDRTAGILRFRSMEDMLLGNIRTYQEEQTNNVVRSRLMNVGAYVTDNWKIRPDLTLDMGLRWQYLAPARAADNNIANFYPDRYDPSRCSTAAFTEDGLVDPAACDTLNGIVTAESPGVPGAALVKKHFNDWEPRVGLAWVPRDNRRFVVRTGFGIYHGRDATSLTSALGLPPPSNRYAELSGLTFGQLVAGGLAPFDPETAQAPTYLQTLDRDYPNAQSYQYSAGVQYQLASSTTLDVGYVGSHQVHQGRNRDINQVPPEFRRDVQEGSLDPSLVRPYLGFANIYVNERAGTTNYNALQTFLSHRMGRRLLIQGAYTYASLTSDAANRDSEAVDAPVLDAYNPAIDKGPGSQDVRHSLAINFDWELPIFSKSTGLTHAFLGGWELAGVIVNRSGMPANVCVDGGISGLQGNECERPDLVGTVSLPRGDRTLLRYFNTDAFVLPQPGAIGTAGRNIVREPGINNWDLSLFKNFDAPWIGGKLAGERSRIQIRADFFNAWNHTQFCGVNTDFVAASSDAGSPADPNSGFGAVNCSRAPREIQLGIKFFW